MVEQSSVPVSTPLQEATEPVQNNAPGYGFMRPSFSYLNAPVNMPGGSSQQPTSSAPGMQSESPRALPSPQAMGSGLPNSQAPSFSYNVGHSSVGFSTSTNAPAPIPTMLPPAPKLASNSGSFVPGAAGQVMAPRGPLPVVVPEGNTSHAGYYPFNGHMQPRPVDQSVRNNVRADGTQETRASPAFVQSASQPAHTNSNPSATHFASNSFNNTTMWMPPGPPFQTHPSVMPRTPSVGASPGLASSAPSPSTMNFQPSLDSSIPPRTSSSNIPSFSNPSIQQQAVAPYPTLSPQAAPGPWLQPQLISGFGRPPFSPYAALSPGPYPMPIRGVSPVAASMPDIQPPGVAPAISSVGALTSSFTSGGQLSVSSAQADLPPGVDNYKHVSNVEPKDEKLDAWTAHRTETGTVYYYNAVTGQSTYEKPSGFNGESDKAIVQPSPVSWEKLAGTDWTLVTTNDGKNYYYNSTTKLSSWQIPSEVTELRKKQDSNGSKTQSLPVINSNIAHGKGSGPAILSTPAANTGGRDATALRASISSGSSSALDLIKKKLQDSGSPPSTSPGQALPVAVTVELNGSKPIEPTIKDSQNESSKDKRKDANGDGDMSDTSSDSEDEERGPSKEECIVQFKDMLKERGVAPFSKWEKELPKIVFDPRFKAIASHSARRALFEHYVRTRAEEERKEKRAAQKAALEGFKLLLEEAKEDIDHNTDYQAFRRKWGEDPRFQALDRKERENLLNERIFPLKRAAQERAQAERTASVSNFKSMLQDNGDITSNSRWSKMKDSLKSDPRYKSVKHEDREKLFNEYIAELKVAEEEVEQKAKEKRDEEEKLKERERALRKRKEREEQEVERVRMKARRKEAVESYQALLVETIKDPEASWTESKPKLEKDPQGRVANPHLDKSDLEKLFRDHVKSLHERRVVEFRALLNEVITTEAAAHETEDGKTVINSWSTAKKLLKDDQRYNKMPRKERESLWRRHAEDIYRKQKSSRDQEQDKHADGKTRNSVDPAKSAASRRTHD